METITESAASLKKLVHPQCTHLSADKEARLKLFQSLRYQDLLTLMLLESFRLWESQYRNFMMQNSKPFKAQGLKIAKAYLNKFLM